MSFFKQNLLREVLGKPAMESSEIVTEEIGSTAGGQVEIERLKQENLDLMEIHALEQDVALIEQQGDGVEELGYAIDEVGELKASMEGYLEKGGMTAADAAGINRSLRFLNRRLGGALNINTPATESFQGATADRITLTVAMEGAIGEFFKKIWDGIVNFFKKIKDTVMGWFGKSEKKADEVKKELDELIKSLPTSGKFSSGEALKNARSILGDRDFAGLTNGFTFDNFSTKLNKQILESKKILDQTKAVMEDVKSSAEKRIVELTSSESKDNDYDGADDSNASKVIANIKSEESYITKIKLFSGKDTDTDPPTEEVKKYSEILVGGKQLFLHKTKAEDNGSYTTTLKLIDSKPNKDSNVNFDEIKPKDDEKEDFSKIKQVCEEARDAIVATSVSITIIASTAETLNKLLNKSISFADDVTPYQKKLSQARLDSFRESVKFAMTNPIIGLSTSAINMASKVVNTAKAAEAAATNASN